MTNREIAQEISNRIGTAPVPFDSVYSIALQIYNELGGEQTQFDSVYSILLEILPLVEGGIKPIEEVSELPNVSENKDKLFRLDNGDKDVYAAKLLSSETITTNRLPDAQQIDKAYLYEDSENIYYYKGAWKVIFSDTEIEGYGWLEGLPTNNEWYFYLTQDDAVDVKSNSICYGTLNRENANIDFVNKIITTDYTSSDIKDILGGEGETPIPATYNAPEANQIGNAYIDLGEMGTYPYVGTEVTTEYEGEQVIGYYWGIPNYDDFVLTIKKASDIYTNEDNLLDIAVIYVNDSDEHIAYDATEYLESIYIPQLNAPDSEQVDNAYVECSYDGENIDKFIYKGETTIHCTDGDYTAYMWLKGNSLADVGFIKFTTYNANSVYDNTSFIALDELYGYIFLDGTDWDCTLSLSEVSDMFEDNSIDLIEGTLSHEISTVKYQRTETTEEWGWQDIIPTYASDSDIDLMFASPVVKRVLMKYGRVDEETGVRYPLTILEGLVNVSGETMEYDGDTYYKWIKYEDRGNGTSTPDEVGDENVIVLTTSLNPTLPFSSSSPEWVYMIGSESEEAVYASPSTETYSKEALIHEDGSITYEE